MHKCPWAGKKYSPTSEWDVSICCTVVQNRPKVVDINSCPHFYSRYVKYWLHSMRTLAATIQSRWREQASRADDDWSGSSRCFYASEWDGIATRLCPLQVENYTCMFYSRKDTIVNDAHLQTLLSKIQKRTQNVATCEEICSSLPTTMSGCDEQNSSESIMAHICKYAHLDNITCWKPVEHGCKFVPLRSNATGSVLWRWWIS